MKVWCVMLRTDRIDSLCSIWTTETLADTEIHKLIAEGFPEESFYIDEWPVDKKEEG